MSRSRRKKPICGFTTCRSEKDEKKIWHRELRRKARQQLINTGEVDIEKRHVSDPWRMGKDGKMGFDPIKYPKGMRK